MDHVVTILLGMIVGSSLMTMIRLGSIKIAQEEIAENTKRIAKALERAHPPRE